MASNQSIVALPADISDDVVLRRVLARIVEAVDTLSGDRDSTATEAATTKQLEAAVSTLEDSISAVSTKLAKALVLTSGSTTANVALQASSANTASLVTVNSTLSSLQSQITALALRVSALESP